MWRYGQVQSKETVGNMHTLNLLRQKESGKLSGMCENRDVRERNEKYRQNESGSEREGTIQIEQMGDSEC